MCLPLFFFVLLLTMVVVRITKEKKRDESYDHINETTYICYKQQSMSMTSLIEVDIYNCYIFLPFLLIF